MKNKIRLCDNDSPHRWMKKMWMPDYQWGEARRYLKCLTKVSTMLRLFLRHCVKIVRKKGKVHSQVIVQYICPGIQRYISGVQRGSSLSLKGIHDKVAWSSLTSCLYWHYDALQFIMRRCLAEKLPKLHTFTWSIKLGIREK